jgi:hypothetical protein
MRAPHLPSRSPPPPRSKRNEADACNTLAAALAERA